MPRLVFFLCVNHHFKGDLWSNLIFQSFFVTWLCRISTFVTLATLQILMSLFLNVSAHHGTQCLCLGLQLSAAWYLYSGSYLLFISKGQFVNKPKHLLRNRKRSLSLCKLNCSISWEHTWALSLRHFFVCLFLDWTAGKSLKQLNINLLFMHKSVIALWFIRSIFIVETCFVLLMHTYLLIVLQNCDFTSLIVVVLDL